MCGILCICSRGSGNELVKDLELKIHSLLSNRGPDSIGNITHGCCFFQGSVLWQQGSSPTPQPVSNDDYVFLFNGDVFSLPPNHNPGLSDTEYMFDQLQNCQTNQEIFDLFKLIRGPYSFILFKKKTNQLFWGRDSLGRNSLIMGFLDNLFYISSVNGVALRNEVIEVPPLGIYCYDLEKGTIELHPWIDDMKTVEYYLERIEEVKEFLKERIGLSVSDTSINYPWLRKSPTNETFRFDELLKGSTATDPEEIFNRLLEDKRVVDVLTEFIDLLSSSVQERISHTPKICRSCPIDEKSCGHPKIGILFSGGIDCTILAVLADLFVDKSTPIELYNVAFEKANAKEPNWNVPDRLSAHEALEELRRINPNRNYNLVEVNVTRRELEEALSSHISHLVYPLTSVLDESLGGALWFASGRGGGPQNNSCRVLLIGSGADELLGGYTRHRNVFRRTGTVEDELLNDWYRLPSRNLARDDRVISDNGVTPRSPFVEERFVHFVRSLHPMQKCYHALPEGLGDKLLLRLCGFQLGLRATASRRKRALQFGSRIADSRQNAKDQSRLLK